jgi:septal ring factor EnvC (AmiA/AmiB activator)
LEVYVSGYFDVSRRHSFDHTLAFNVPQLCQQALEQHARRSSRAEESPEQQAEKEYRHVEEICNQLCKDRRSIDDQISSLDRKAQQLRAELQLYEEAAEKLREEADRLDELYEQMQEQKSNAESRHFNERQLAALRRSEPGLTFVTVDDSCERARSLGEALQGNTSVSRLQINVDDMVSDDSDLANLEARQQHVD